jgi:hypothetical protein
MTVIDLGRIAGPPAAPRIGQRTIAADGPPDPRTNPFEAFLYTESRRRSLIDSVRQRPLLRLWDRDMRPVGQIAQERSVEVTELMSDAGAASAVIRRDNWLSDFILHDRRAYEDLHFTLDPIPTKPDWRTRWGGKVVATEAKRSAEGLHTVELQMISNREHCKHILAGSNPLSPPEVQWPRVWTLPMNLRSGLSISMFINLARQFHPALSIPTNMFNPGGWIGTGIFQGLDPRSWPIQVQFCNPIFDQSRFSIFSSRWTDFHSVADPLLADAGCFIRAYTWLPEDDTSPHPELELRLPGLQLVQDAIDDLLPGKQPGTGTLADLARPTRPAIIMAVEDKSGVGGPTGTMADGWLNLIAATGDDLLTEVLLPFDKDHDGSTDPVIRKWFSVAPKKPHVLFRDGEYSGIIESKRTAHASTAKTIMVGSKSPAWLNQTISFGIKYGLSQLSAVIQALVGPEVTGLQAPGTPGLEEVYQDQLADVFAAWQRYTPFKRAFESGDYGFLEHYEPGTGTAYTVSAQLDLRSGAYKTRAYTSFDTTVRNGRPWLADVDFTLGDRCGFQMGQTIYTDQCTGITRRYDRDNPLEVQLRIGDDREDEDPVSRAMRTLAVVWNSITSALGQGDVF